MTNEERQQAIEWLKRRPVMMAGAKKMFDLAIEALEQPEIIRCKDCKYSVDQYNDGTCYCKRPSRELVWIGRWDFFCKAGTKREGEADGSD